MTLHRQPLTWVAGAALAAAACNAGPGPDAAKQRTAPAPREAWRVDEKTAFADADRSGRHVVIDFRATWCEPCKEIEAILERDEIFAELTRSFVPLEFDITELTTEDAAHKTKYKAFDLPAVIFVSAAGDELGRVGGDVKTPEAFIGAVRSIVDEHPPPGQ